MSILFEGWGGVGWDGRFFRGRWARPEIGMERKFRIFESKKEERKLLKESK